MEICPEFVVLQSAFKLVDSQAGEYLHTLKKTACRPYTTIIVTAINEICHGLQSDNDKESSLQWEQKLHATMLYCLVQKKYIDIQTPIRPGSIPCLNAMDMIVGLLPTYSTSLYFEIVKQKQWACYFFQALPLLDHTTAAGLLTDLLNHLLQEPVTLADREVISIATNTFLKHCLYVPPETSQILRECLCLLRVPRKHICTLYQEATTDLVTMGTEVAPIDNNNSDIFQQNAFYSDGITFWGGFVESNFDFLKMVIEDLNNRTSHFDTPISNDFCLLGQIGLLAYLYLVGNERALDCWLINNMFGGKVLSYENCGIDLIRPLYGYMVNKRLAKQIANQIDLNTLKSVLERFDFAAVAKTPVVKLVLETGASENGECPFRCLMLESKVFLQMVEGVRAYQTKDLVVDNQDGEDLFICGGDRVCDLQDVVYGETWTDDVTADALLWRIQESLPQMEGCMENLLQPKCWKFWQYDRLWDVLRQEIQILAKSKRLMQMLEIVLHYKQMGNSNQWESAQQLETGAGKSNKMEADTKLAKVTGEVILGSQNVKQREVIYPLTQLFTLAFQELSLTDQDCIVRQIHSSRDIRGLFPEIDRRELTHLFNKITSDMDAQVIKSVLLMCLKDPLVVMETIVSSCVQNERQARSTAAVLGYLKQTCSLTSPDWPERQLLTHVLSSWLTSEQLSDKQTKCFLIFLREMLQVENVIDVEGFLQFVILPHLSTDHLQTTAPTKVAMTLKMSLTLFLAILQSKCMAGFDWLNSIAEPIVLLVTLAGLLNECLVLWTHNPSLESDHTDLDTENVKTEMTLSKLAVKELTIACLKQLQTSWKGMDDDIFMNDACGSWLIDALHNHHWTVQVLLAEVLETVGLSKFAEQWKMTLVNSQLSLLDCCQVAAMSNTFSDALPVPRQMDYETWLKTLVLLLPHLMPSEVQNVFMYLSKLMNDSAELCWSYRTLSTNVLPSLDFRDVRSTLLMSQLLKDVYVTMTLTLTISKVKLALLQHSLRSYVAFIQTCCDSLTEPCATHLFCLSELFHHACELTVTLDPEVRDAVLVLMMHIVTRFKDVSMGISNDVQMTTNKKLKMASNCDKMLNSNRYACRYGRHLEQGMLRVLDDLPDEYEEKRMMKKQLLVDG
ncbi:uncharacterized protein LOC127839182 isoform X2 [Dreissena polymorpha]|uniref:Uncharacterized protein n=1 Tax=Dreissena polymorpha TaxID=45954 RepID=A0A9D4FDK5_DREPO|nr:uncharacterized protein LOC127839182 isoform X2 [Dreissena polymorpha]XP_052223391.1 uncharacterized protein LOC127839182 isoform X2 [Dreissena polymorpha]XP_052223392.1 uncharacterized protein LOC127839182 isoform X2 [Dreissena polymorpha]XP_052223393.1 uncharacterized protein LOC127839182 isoform X2 [Dreissena polymorpha]KAH3796943.1 hypothetical protein DPMN_150519 [Dreissena polymorpha]